MLHEFVAGLHAKATSSWIIALSDRVAEYVKAGDADLSPAVPDRLRLHNLPQGADFDAFRNLVEGEWDDVWDELVCSTALKVFEALKR